MSASTQVFNTLELLRMILELTEPRNLLSHQQVNKTWQGVIKTSPILQQKLHYKVDPLKDSRGNPFTWNPFIGYLSLPHPYSRFGLHSFDTEIFHKHNFHIASWKDMHLTTPAITEMLLIEDQDEYHLEFEAGITFCQLFSSLEDNVEYQVSIVELNGNFSLQAVGYPSVINSATAVELKSKQNSLRAVDLNHCSFYVITCANLCSKFC